MGKIESKPDSGERRQTDRPIFSAFQLGKICTKKREENGELSLASIPESASVASLHDIYTSIQTLDFLPVARNDAITGYLRRQMFFAQLSETRFSRELLLRQEMTAANMMESRVTILDAGMNLSEASEVLMRRDEEIRFDPFVVTWCGDFFGTSTVQRVIEGLNRFLIMDSQACDRMQKRIMEPMNRQVEIAAEYHTIIEPLIAPGGDYADVIELNDRYTLAVLFDVCGKGLKAATMVTSIASVLKTLIYKLDADGIDLPRILLMMHSANQLLYTLTCQEMYATGVVLILDKERLVLSVLDYGHGLLWLKRGKGVHRLSAHIEHDLAIPFLGIHENLDLPAGHFRLERGDTLFACSDGIVESKNLAKEEYGVDRVKRLLRSLPCSSAQAQNMAIHEDWESFTEGTRRTDDLSQLSIRL